MIYQWIVDDEQRDQDVFADAVLLDSELSAIDDLATDHTHFHLLWYHGVYTLPQQIIWPIRHFLEPMQ